MSRTYESLSKRNTIDENLMDNQIYEFHAYKKIGSDEHFGN